MGPVALESAGGMGWAPCRSNTPEPKFICSDRPPRGHSGEANKANPGFLADNRPGHLAPDRQLALTVIGAITPIDAPDEVAPTGRKKLRIPRPQPSHRDPVATILTRRSMEQEILALAPQLSASVSIMPELSARPQCLARSEKGGCRCRWRGLQRPSRRGRRSFGPVGSIRSSGGFAKLDGGSGR